MGILHISGVSQTRYALENSVLDKNNRKHKNLKGDKNMSEYQLNTGKIGEKVVDAFVDTFLEKKDDKKAEENKEE